MTTEQPKPSSAEIDPAAHGQKLARLVASDQEGESASAMRQFGLWAARNGVSNRVSDILAVEVPHLLAGNGKTRAELAQEIADLKRENEDLYTINQALGAQNEAVIDENTRLRKKPWTTKLGEAFRNAASGIGESAPEGLKKTGDIILSAAIGLSYLTIGPLAPVVHKAVRGEERFNQGWGRDPSFFTIGSTAMLLSMCVWGITAAIDSKEGARIAVNDKVIQAAAAMPACPSLSLEKNATYKEYTCGSALIQGPFKSPIFGFNWKNEGPVIVKKKITASREQVSGTTEDPQYMVCTRQTIDGLRPPTNEDFTTGMVEFTHIRQEPKCELQPG